MAEETTTTLPETDEFSSQLDFTDEELAALDGPEDDAELGAEDEEDPQGEAGEEESGEGEEEEDDEAVGDESDEEGEEGEETEGDEEEAGEEEEGAEEEAPVFELEVKGQTHTVEGVDDLAALAQKGIFFEAECNQMRSKVKAADFTMNAMLNDPTGFMEAYLTQKNGGNYEQARADVYKICDKYMQPILQEIGATPEEQARIRQGREEKLRLQKEREEYQNQTFTHEDVEWLRVAQHNVGVALEEVGLPKDSPRMVKRMADIMREQNDAGRDIHPQQAANLLRGELEALGAEIRTRKGSDKPRTKKEKLAAIKKARAKKSRKKTGNVREGQRREEPVRSMSAREFTDSIDKALNLDRY